MLLIRDDQMVLLGQSMVARDQAWLMVRLREEFPDYPREAVEYLYTRACMVGFSEREHIWRYCRMAPFLGHDLDDDAPLVRLVCIAAEQEALPVEARLDYLEQEILPRLLGDAWRPPGS